MRRTITLLALLLGLVLVAASPAGAVTGNFQKDFEHEYVGLIVFYDEDGEFLWRCSGSLLTDRVFLTAGHCADVEEGAVSARVYFEQDAGAHYDPELGYDPVSGYPLIEVWVNPDDQKEFKLVPQFYNCDSIGYRYDLTGEDIDSWGALLDPKYKGKSAILNDSLLTPGWAAGYLKKSGIMPEIERTDDMTHEELDKVIDYLIERKKDGQFRAIWEDYGQCVNLLASGEAWVTDSWNPVVEDVKKQGVVCKYAFPKEGFTAWYHGIAVRKDTENLDAALDYINFCLEGWWGSQVAGQGYYSPTTTCDVYLQQTRNTDPNFTDYDWWYRGGSSPDPKPGWPLTGRDTGAYERRWGNLMHWMVWPQDPDYYAKRWNDFLSA
jgi:putative spermidine/putrescine transport system substrate-binding protein